MPNAVHQSTVLASEGTRQVAVAAAIAAGGAAGVVGAAVIAATVAHYKRVVASAILNNNGLGMQPALDALRSSPLLAAQYV